MRSTGRWRGHRMNLSRWAFAGIACGFLRQPVQWLDHLFGRNSGVADPVIGDIVGYIAGGIALADETRRCGVVAATHAESLRHPVLALVHDYCHGNSPPQLDLSAAPAVTANARPWSGRGSVEGSPEGNGMSIWIGISPAPSQGR